MGHSETDCRQVVERLFLYIDGEIPAGECGGIDAHLQRCAECLGHVDFEREVKSIIRRKCSEGVAPVELANRLRVRLERFLDDRSAT